MILFQSIQTRAIQKTHKQISDQMERIYTLYGQGYGTNKMLHNAEQKVYRLFTQIRY